MNLLIIFGAKYLYVLICLLALTLFIFSNKVVKIGILKLSILALPFSFILAKFLNLIIVSPRPFVVEHLVPLIEASADNGFPSDHTLLAMTISSIIYTYNKKVGTILILLSILVGFARIAAQVHHLVDVLGSLLIALVATFVSCRYLTKKLAIRQH